MRRQAVRASPWSFQDFHPERVVKVDQVIVSRWLIQAKAIRRFQTYAVGSVVFLCKQRLKESLGARARRYRRLDLFANFLGDVLLDLRQLVDR